MYCAHRALERKLFKMGEAFEFAEALIDLIVGQALHAPSAEFFDVE